MMFPSDLKGVTVELAPAEPEEEPYEMPSHVELRQAADVIHRARMSFTARDVPGVPAIYHRDYVLREALNTAWQVVTCLSYEVREEPPEAQ